MRTCRSARPSPNRGGSTTERRQRHVPPPAGPDLLGRQSAATVRCPAQLAAPHRSGAPVAAGFDRLRHRRRRGVPARHVARTLPRSGSMPTTQRRPRRRPRPAGHRLRQHRGRPELRRRPASGRAPTRPRCTPGNRLRGERRIRPRPATTRTGLELTANPHYWAGHAGRHDDRPGRRPRRPGPGRGVRGGRPRLHAGRRHRRDLARPTTRRSVRSSAWSTRSRSSTTASTRRQPPFDDVARPARRSARRSTGGGWPP